MRLTKNCRGKKSKGKLQFASAQYPCLNLSKSPRDLMILLKSQLAPMRSPWPLLPGAVYPHYPCHTCAPFSSLLHYLLSHTHTAVHHGDGRFRCAAQVSQGVCHRQFNLHQLSPFTLKNQDLFMFGQRKSK